MSERIPAFSIKEQESLKSKEQRTEISLRSLEEDESQVASFNFALDAVLSGAITNERTLEALAKARYIFNRIERESFLVDEQDYPVFVRGSKLRREDIPVEALSEEDFKLCFRLLGIINNQTLPTELRENLRNYVQTNDIKTLERTRYIMADLEDNQMSSNVNDLISDLINRKRRQKLKSDVYGGIVENKQVSELFATTFEFQGKGVTDLELVGELQAAIFAKQKREIVSLVNSLLQVRGRDIEEAINQTASLLRSRRVDEVEAGAVLLRTTYQLELAHFKESVQEMISRDVDPEMVRIYIDGFPVRPSFEGIDYVETIVETREKVFQSIEAIAKARKLEKANVIRRSFPLQDIEFVFEEIDRFGDDTEEDQAIRDQLLELYKSYVAINKPEIFDTVFAEEIRERESRLLKERFVSPEKGRNKESFNFLRTRFVETVYPLIESFRADSATALRANSFLEKKDGADTNPRRQFDQRVSLLEKQRPLSETENEYLRSVEMLSVFNPYLVACAYTDPGVTSEFLRHHFETTSERTTSNLKDGDYFPLLQVGLGPNGLAALGETVRNNSGLAGAMLVVDAGKQPGGPFAVPEGAAWELNSANKRGFGGRVLPKQPGIEELKTVRGFGSPLRWYPGERGAGGKDIRQGSINTTVDYLPTPDDISSSRYSTNEELALILALQTAVLTKNIALQTKVIGIEKNTDPHTKGDKLVTLEIVEQTGKRTVKVGVDALFTATGLGEPGYGFNLEGSKAQKVIAETRDMGFPKITQTLEAFNALAGRSNEQISPGETLVIWGKGNSADTLIEYIGNLFNGENPRVRDVTKVYVVSDGDLSARPRYSLINDLRPRNGRGNLIEPINGKVVDVDFATSETDISKRKLIFFGKDGNPIKDSAGNEIIADSGIAATGFASKLDSLLEGYSDELSDGRLDKKREKVTLPTNEKIAVAETLTTDPGVLILGVASDADFENIDKLGQLPPEAREALLRNGAENAVAIGFRGPDTQAAVNIWLNSRDINIESGKAGLVRDVLDLNDGEYLEPGELAWLDTVVEPESIRIPNNIQDEVRLLSPLFSYNVGNSIELVSGDKKFTGELTFAMTYSLENKMLGLEFVKGSVPVSRKILTAVKEACMDDDFQKYALFALKKKRREPRLDLVLSFKNGFVDPKKTFVQD
jgi:hypothetical protein